MDRPAGRLRRRRGPRPRSRRSRVGRCSSRLITVMPSRPGAVGVEPAVGEVGDAELHHPRAGEPGLEQPAHGRAVADAVAQVVVGVERDEPGRRQAAPNAPSATGKVSGVVAAERDDEPRARGRGTDGGVRALLPGLVVGLVDVAEVRDDEPVEVELVAMGRVARSAVRIASGVWSAPVCDSDVRHVGTPMSASRAARRHGRRSRDAATNRRAASARRRADRGRTGRARRSSTRRATGCRRCSPRHPRRLGTRADPALECAARDGLWFRPAARRAISPLHADVAQLVAHHLAKVRVAGSSPVVRSKRSSQTGSDSVEWPRGEATACKAVYTGSNPVSTSGTTEGFDPTGDWRRG